ncbi:MAG: metallophosphoesterase [Parachlamydiales bacterium]|nr:metallophosphoesterase [Parachlamydiales bacterium]
MKNIAWDLFCIISIIGIWPRFIEPQILSINKKSITIPLPQELDGLKILHFSDLHFNNLVSKKRLMRIQKAINALDADILLFTGDWICQSKLDQPEILCSFLKGLIAPLGIYSILGNHDYQSYVTKNEEGNFDIERKNRLLIAKIFSKLFGKNQKRSGLVTKDAAAVPFLDSLIELLKTAGVKLLHNQSILIPYSGTYFNLVGLGDLWLDKADIHRGFKDYNKHYPGIAMVHNPDAFDQMQNCPMDIVLCGHTHGAQVNLPWLSNKFVGVENKKYKRGLMQLNGKWVHISRGLGSKILFRWFSTPEITLLTLRKSHGIAKT